MDIKATIEHLKKLRKECKQRHAKIPAAKNACKGCVLRRRDCGLIDWSWQTTGEAMSMLRALNVDSLSVPEKVAKL
jgi:hypothetical protein